MERDYRLVAQNNLDVRLEIVKRQKHEAKIVNGKFYPQPTRYGYRITGLPVRTMTLNELKELIYNLNLIVQSERE